jgi:N-acetylneuraminate synthase/N,N'-diacetyllegionaminate synthase
MFEMGATVTRRQDLPEIYWHNGQIYIIRREHLFRFGDWYEGKCLPYICPAETFMNIDHGEDLRPTEKLLYEQRQNRVEQISFDISDKKIGYRHPCFIIAEAGVNHNGDMDLAKDLVDAASKAGVDAIKFQFFDPENVVTSSTPMAEYQKVNLESDRSQQDMLSALVLSESEIRRLKGYSEQKGLIFLCTSHSGIREYAQLDQMGVCAHKVGSGDLLNLPVLRYLAGTKKPIILGTGMSTIEDVKAAHRVLVRNGNERVVFLHCTTDYPCPFSDVNMNAMLTMKMELECPVGYSDHTLGIEVPVMAVSLGACVLEKHLTLDRSLPGPDHRASIVPEELNMMVTKIRNVEMAMGYPEKRPTSREKETSRIARKSLVYSRDLTAGSVIAEDDIAVKRPGTGVSPLQYDEFIGRGLTRPVLKDAPVSEEDFFDKAGFFKDEKDSGHNG